jgi:hypothetical protein
MHRVWVGLDPHQALMGVGAFVVGAVLFMHMWAFSQFNWPSSLKAKYANTATPAAVK